VDITNAKLSLSLLDATIAASTTPQTFLLIDKDVLDPVAGMFTEIDLGIHSSLLYSIKYAFSGAALNGVGTGNDVAITFYRVPEPSTLLLTLLTTVEVLVRRRL
jgi:hypothetical protein